MTWEPEIEEMKRRTELALRMGGEERIADQHGRGKLTIRERIEMLIDSDSFRERGLFAGTGAYDERGKLTDFFPAGTVL